MSYAQTRAHVISILPKGGIGAEIGVWKGDFSAQILADAAPKRLHLIDPWVVNTEPSHAKSWYGSGSPVDIEDVHRNVLKRFQSEIESGQAQIHRMPSTEALVGLPDEGLDFVYVDGDHAYNGVRADLMAAFHKIKPGGLICVDDHMDGKWWGDGVIRAVNELLGAHPARLEVIFAYQTQVVIRKR